MVENIKLLVLTLFNSISVRAVFRNIHHSIYWKIWQPWNGWLTWEAFSFPATAGTMDRNLLNSTCLTWRRYLRIMAFALYWVGLPCGLLRLLSARRYKLFLLHDESRLFEESESCPNELVEGDDIDDRWEHVGFNRSANAKFIFGWLILLLWLVFGSIHPNAAIFVLNV